MKVENFAFVAPASNFAGRSSRGCGCKFLRDIMRLPLVWVQRARPSKFLFDAGATKVKNVAAFAKSCRNECRLAIRIVDGETRLGSLEGGLELNPELKQQLEATGV